MMRRSVRIGALLAAAFVLAACVKLGFRPLSSTESDGSAPDQRAEDGPLLDRTTPADRESGNAEGPPPTSAFKLFLALEGHAASHFRVLDYDGQQSLTLSGPPLRLPDLPKSSVRGLTSRPDGSFIAGSGYSATAQLIDSTGTKAAGTLSLDNKNVISSQVPMNLHGLCLLPNGNLIIGEYGGGSGNAVSEYTLTGGLATFHRPVFATTLDAGTLGHCAAPSNTQLYLAVIDANTDTDGDVVQLSFASTSQAWMEVGRFDMSVFDKGSKTAVYTFVLHTNGSLYIFPLRRYGKQVKSLIRCPTAPLSAENCVLKGALPLDTTSAANGPDTINVARQVPGSDDMLFGTNRRIYRYRLASDTYEALMDMWTSFSDLKDENGAPDQLAQLRGMVIRQ